MKRDSYDIHEYSNCMPFMYFFNVTNCNMEKTSQVCITCVLIHFVYLFGK